LIAALIVLVPFSSRAEEINNWEFEIAPRWSLPNITGEGAVGLIDPIPIDVGPRDILDSLNHTGTIEGEARHKSNFGVILSYAFVDLENKKSGPLGRAQIGGDLFQGILEAYGTYRINLDQSTFDTYVGGRWIDVDLGVDLITPIGSTRFTKKEDWVDPVIGAQWIPTISEEWKLLVQGDLGGFGVSSDLAWTAMAGVIWEANHLFSVKLLYKALGVDYQTGIAGTRSRFVYDAVAHGPTLGVIFAF